jgi:hypothetical protein
MTKQDLLKTLHLSEMLLRKQTEDYTLNEFLRVSIQKYLDKINDIFFRSL